MSKLVHALCAGLGVLIFCFDTAKAATFTQDKAAFDLATSGLAFSSNDFSTFPSTGNVWNYGGFTVSSTRNIVAIGGSGCGGDTCLQFEKDITISFSQPVSAVSFYLRHLVAVSADVVIDGTDVGDASWSNPSFFFFGVYDLNTPFSTVSLPGDRFIFYLDDLSWSTAVLPDDEEVGSVPLPAAGWMLIAGLGGLAAMRRRKAA